MDVYRRDWDGDVSLGITSILVTSSGGLGYTAQRIRAGKDGKRSKDRAMGILMLRTCMRW